jgi:hypothetical protein
MYVRDTAIVCSTLCIPNPHHVSDKLTQHMCMLLRVNGTIQHTASVFCGIEQCRQILSRRVCCSNM